MNVFTDRDPWDSVREALGNWGITLHKINSGWAGGSIAGQPLVIFLGFRDGKAAGVSVYAHDRPVLELAAGNDYNNRVYRNDVCGWEVVEITLK